MPRETYQRPVVAELLSAIQKNLKVIHILVGPRQIGKTTAALQVARQWNGEVVHAAADSPLPPTPEWIEIQWETALRRIHKNRPVLLILDEIQKVRGWSETVKRLWDEEQQEQRGLRVILLGSSALLMQRGMTESLTGRFFLYRLSHWGYEEMRKAFGLILEEWLFFGGYPGAMQFRADTDAWRRYVADSLVETVLSRDVLQLQTVTKPALLRHLFGFAAAHPAEIFSYNKMLGQLHDAGNTTTLSHYLKLLETAFLASGLESFRPGKKIQRGSSPKLILWNTALINAYRTGSAADLRSDTAFWGRLVENAAGAHLLSHLDPVKAQLYYWREGDLEVDFIVKTPKTVWAVEIKTGRKHGSAGLEAFLKKFPGSKPLVVGTGGMKLEEFFESDPQTLF